MGITALRRKHFHRGDKFTERDLARPFGTFGGRHHLNIRRRRLLIDYGWKVAGYKDPLRSRRGGPHRIADKLYVGRSRAAATTDELCAGLNESLGKLWHVLRRAH